MRLVRSATLAACATVAACATLVACAALTACAPSRRPPEFLGGPSTAQRPFSRAVRANGFLFLAGQIGADSTGRLAPGGIRAETRQTLENIRGDLARYGVPMSQVVKCTVFLADMHDWPAMNEVYATFFPPDRRPARSAMGANGLALDARVEIECVAAV